MLDESVLAAYLQANVPGFKGPLSAGKFPGGQSNPTFGFFRMAAIAQGVAKRASPGMIGQ
jgi:aminoglycoside phosphotransferase (APT) family kinase protein